MSVSSICSLLSSLADSTLPLEICFMASEVSIRGGPDVENSMPKTSALMSTMIHSRGVRSIRLASMYVRGRRPRSSCSSGELIHRHNVRRSTSVPHVALM